MSKRICVVGAGYWGNNHIRTLQGLGALGGIVESNSKTLNMFAHKYPSVKGYAKLEDALKDNYDAYTVATPAETHYSIAKKIINNSNHILIEKPMALSVEEAKDLLSLAKDKKISIMVGHVLLFHPAIKKIKNLVNDGVIGELQYIYSNRLNLGKIRTEENVFWSLAPHDIAIFQYITDSIPKYIQSKGSTFLQEGIPDSTMTTLQYENGVEGHIFVSWLHPFKEHRLVVIGSEAMISFEDSLEGKPLKLYSKKFDLISGVPEKVDGPVEWIPYEQKMPLTEQFEYFINHLNGNKPKIANGEQGVEVVKILVKASKQILS